GAAGLLSRSRGAPNDAVPTAGQSIPVQPPKVQVVVRAVQPVRVTITSDGRVQFQGLLRRDEVRTFTGNQAIVVQLEKGGQAFITVNRHDLGHPGTKDAPFEAT